MVIANFGAPDSFRVDDIELLYEDFQDSNCIDFMFRTIAKLWIYTSTFLFRDENEFQKDLRYVRLLCILLVTRYYNYFLLQNKIDIKNKEYKQLQYDILLKQQECELFLLELTLVFFMGLNDSGRRKIVHKNQQDKEIAALKKVYNTILEKKIGKFTEKLLEESSFFTDDLRIQPPLSSRL